MKDTINLFLLSILYSHHRDSCAIVATFRLKTSFNMTSFSSLGEMSVLKLQPGASTMPLNRKHLPIMAKNQTETRKATSFTSLPEISVLKVVQLAAFTKTLNHKPLPIKAKQTTTKAKRSVRFSNINTVTTRPISSEQELRTMWYEDEEYRSFQKECRHTLAAIKTAKGNLSTLDPTEYSVQGLEQFLSPKQMTSRKKKAKRYIDVMMRQQYVQKRTGKSDPSRLKELSEMFSKQAGQRAHLRGVIDHALTVDHSMKEIRRVTKRRNGMSML
jgi:hypothetical protein